MKSKFDYLKEKFDELKARSEKGEKITTQEWDELSFKLDNFQRIVSLGEMQTSSLHFDEIEKHIKKEAKALLNCEMVHLYRYNEKDNKLSLRVQNPKTKKSHYVFYDVDETTFAGSCAHFKATLQIEDVTSDIRYARMPKEIKEEIQCKNILLTPIIYEGELLGLIQAINAKGEKFQDDEIYILEVISGQLSVVMEKNLLYEKLQDQFLQIVQALADSIGKKDLYTGGHTKRVGIFAEKIGQELGLTYKELHDLKVAAMLHDIGKIGIEDAILKKRAPLTDDEFKVMREHPRLGYEILGHIDGLENVIDGMRYHHERPDGKGYPYGLKGEDIPMISHIISVADTFDAMISTRPYRKGLPPMVAYEEISKYSGTQFDSDVVDAFKRYFEKSSMYRPDKVVPVKKVG